MQAVRRGGQNSGSGKWIQGRKRWRKMWRVRLWGPAGVEVELGESGGGWRLLPGPFLCSVTSRVVG